MQLNKILCLYFIFAFSGKTKRNIEDRRISMVTDNFMKGHNAEINSTLPYHQLLITRILSVKVKG